jgi:V/A-type H+-transporting ATPase subunit E
LSGLDQIIERILHESAAECDAILKKAQAECEIIQLENEKKAAQVVLDIKTAADADTIKLLETARQRAETDCRKKLLHAQQMLVSEVIEQAAERLKSLPENEYFVVLTKLLARYSQQQTGEILLGSADVKRISTEFKAELDRYPLEIVEDARLNGGGFILRYGEIEENCMFSALLADKHEAVHDKVYHILFG